jgi:general secretion pathway protein K
MIAIFVLSVLAGAFAYSMKVEAKLAQNANNQADLEWIGRSGVEYARWVLALQLSIPNEPYDSLNQKWAGGPGSNASSNSPLAEVSLDDVQLGNGSFSVKIKDLERKININTADQETLERTLRAMGADANAISSISDSILDWIDRDDSTHVNGAESDYYQGLTPPYLAKNGPIDDLSELLLIKGIWDQPELYWGPSAAEHIPASFQKVDRFGNPLEMPTYAFGLVDVFTPISTGRVNINTAPAQTLEAMFGDPNIAQQVIRVRAGPDGADGTEDDTPFASVGELATVGFNQAAAPQLTRYCTVRSSTFEVQVDAQIGSSKQTFYAILGRTNAKDIQVLSFYRK